MVLDVLIVVPAVVILLASFQNNQRKKAGRLLKWFFAFGIVMCLFAFNLFGVPNLIMTYVDYASPAFNFIPAAYRSSSYTGFYVYLIILIVSLILYAIFVVFGLLFSKERKRLRNPLYAPRHRWYWGLVVGVFRAILATYVVILLVKFTVPLTQFDVNSSFIITLIDNFDPIFPKLTDTIAGLTVPWIV